jgi:integrase
MANRAVTLYRKCKTPGGWKRYPAAMSSNGKVKPNGVVAGGVEAVFPIGHYELRSFEGSKTVWTRIEGTGTEALARLKLAQKKSNAIATADDAGVQVVVGSQRVALRDAATNFVKAAVNRKAFEAAEIYKRTTDDFLDGCPKLYADQIGAEDVLQWHGRMRSRGLSERTVSNRHGNLRAFLLSLGLDVKTVAGKAPKFEKTMPKIYERQELTEFFASLDLDYDRLLFDVLLTTGLREREAMHLEWVDLSSARRTIKVRSKLAYKHKIKDAEEREMPLTEDLVERLSVFRELHPKVKLVFGAGGGEVDVPDGHLLRRLKLLVRKAGLNCGTCETCRSSKSCSGWFLHKFRATYITMMLRSGLDLRTVMKLSGHADIESVMRYLRPAEGLEVQERVNSINWH